MSRILTISLFLFVCVSSACKKVDVQNDLVNGKDVSYLFDPVSETCAVTYDLASEISIAWQVPCTPAVIAKLDASVQDQARAAAARNLPAEDCPHRPR